MAQPRKASDVEGETVEWLWEGRIPKGMITLVAGKPDQGKGLFASHVAAEVSNSGKKVLYSAAEDSMSLMTKPRLEAAGANLENILLWRFRLPANGRELGQLITEQNIDLVIIDPLASHLSNGISRHSDNVRTVLTPLTELIEKTRTSVLIIEHALKRVPKTGHPLDAIGGSGSGVPAAARAAFVFGIDPDDGDRRILAKAKFNIGPDPKALAFEIDVEEIEMKNGKRTDVPVLVPDEELLAFDPLRLFENKNQPAKNGRPPEKRAAAAEWLTTYLAESGKTLVHTIQEDAKQYGMSAKTLRRAGDDMGVVKDPPGGGRSCKWELPDDVKEMIGLPTGDDGDEDGAVDGTEQPIAAADVEVTDEDLAQLLGGGDEDGDED